MRWLTGLLVLLIAHSAFAQANAPASAQQASEPPSITVLTGNDMMDEFAACDKMSAVKAGDELQPTLDSVMRCRHLLGYIQGVYEVVQGTCLLKQKFTLLNQSVCIPDGVTQPQLYDVVRQYIQNHPEDRHYPGSMLIASAILHAWPQPSKQ